MGVDDAREAGARALFGEKYGDEVRVVSMGKTAREHGGNALGWSVELCGGTHVRRTGDIGLISVTGESAVASGVRRIEALTGHHARKHANDSIALAKSAAGELRTTLDDMPARIAALIEERKRLERDLSDARKKLAMGGGASASSGSAAGANGVRQVGNVKLMARAVEGIEMKDLKSLVDAGKKQLGSGVVAIVAVTEDGKAGVVVGVTSDLTSRFNAIDLVRVASEALGGKGGGGRPDMAQAGGPDGAKAGRRSRRSKKPWVAAALDGGNPSAQKAAERSEYALSSLGIIDLLAFLPASCLSQVNARRCLPIPRRRTRAISPRVKLRKLRRPTAAPGNWAAAGGLSRLRDNIVAAVTAENADSRFSEQGGKVA